MSLDFICELVPMIVDRNYPITSCIFALIHHSFPICSTHRIHGAGIYANIWGIWMVNVTIYSIHGSYGAWGTILPCMLLVPLNQKKHISPSIFHFLVNTARSRYKYIPIPIVDAKPLLFPLDFQLCLVVILILHFNFSWESQYLSMNKVFKYNIIGKTNIKRHYIPSSNH